MDNGKYLLPDWRTPEKVPIRNGFGEGLLKIGEDERVVVLTADLAESCRVKPFEEKWPERFFEVGVAEQNMAGVGAGMALTGLVPFIASYAVFSPGRNYEQIRMSIAFTKANVKILSSHAGLATGKNGPSHQALEDVAQMRALPGMVVLTPADANQCAAAVEAAYRYRGPVYIRSTRPATPRYIKPEKFEIGKAYIYKEGSDLTIVSYGIQVWEALRAAEILEKEGMSLEVINASTIKPLDEATILGSVKKTGRLLSFEDHQTRGGLGGAVAEMLGEKLPTKMKILGVNDSWGGSGDYEELYEKFGLTSGGLVNQVRKFMLDL